MPSIIIVIDRSCSLSHFPFYGKDDHEICPVQSICVSLTTQGQRSHTHSIQSSINSDVIRPFLGANYYDLIQIFFLNGLFNVMLGGNVLSFALIKNMTGKRSFQYLVVLIATYFPP